MAELVVQEEDKINLVIGQELTDPTEKEYESNCGQRHEGGNKLFLTAVKKIKFSNHEISLEIEFGDCINLNNDTGRLEKDFYEMTLKQVTKLCTPSENPVPVCDQSVTLEVGSSMYLANDDDKFINRSNNKTAIWYLHHDQINTYQIFTHDRNYRWAFNSSRKLVFLQKVDNNCTGEDTDNYLFVVDTGDTSTISPLVEKDLQIIDKEESVNTRFIALQATSQFVGDFAVRVSGYQ